MRSAAETRLSTFFGSGTSDICRPIHRLAHLFLCFARKNTEHVQRAESCDMQILLADQPTGVAYGLLKNMGVQLGTAHGDGPFTRSRMEEQDLRGSDAKNMRFDSQKSLPLE